MSDGLTPATSTEPSSEPATGRSVVRVVVRQAVTVVVVFAVVGALSGVVWYELWTPPKGSVVDHGWYPDETGLRHLVGGTGWYVVVALVAGLCLGVLTSWFFDRSELATLAAVVVGSLVAGVLMREVGHLLGPADPHTLAKTTSAKTLDGDLSVTGKVPLVSFPLGALLGLCAVYLVTSRRGSANTG